MFEKCPNCLKRVVKGSKFCTHCGEKMPIVVKEKRRKVNKNFVDVDFTEGKQLFNRYKKYFVDRIKDPTVSMKKSMNKESFQFGLVQLIVLILINSLTVLILNGKINSGITYDSNISMLSLFVGALILQLFYLLNTIISLYVSANYLKKVPTTIQTITSRVGGLASSQLILSIVISFAVLTKIGPLYYAALSLFGLITISSMSLYIFSIKNNSKIPNFYTLVLTMALLLIIQLITTNLLMRFSTNPQIYLKIVNMVWIQF